MEDTLLIGSYTERMDHVDGVGTGVTVARLAAGELRHVGSFPARNPSWLAYDPARRMLYAVSEVDDRGSRGGEGLVVSFARDGGHGFQPIAQQPSGGSFPAHAALDAAGRILVVVNYGSGSVAAFETGGDGGLSPRALVSHHGRSVDPVRQTSPHAHQAAFDPLGGELFVPDLGTDSVEIHRLTSEGALTSSGSLRVRAGSGPRHVLFTVDGRGLLVLNELDSTIDVFARTAGGFVHAQTVALRPDDSTRRHLAAALRSTSDGRLVFATIRGMDAIAVLTWSVGRLERVALVPSGGREPRDCVVTSDDRHLLVANQDSHEVSVFAIDADDTSISLTGGFPTPSPACLLLVGD